MNETKAIFIIKKYRSILRAAIIIEAVNFIVSLTDSIIAGNTLGNDAFAALGLFAPFLSIATFIGSIINTGTVLNYTLEVGRFNKRRANELFSQGVIMALLAGFLFSAVLFFCGNSIIDQMAPDAMINQYLKDYYYIILVFLFLLPLSFLLDNLMIADGGENLSAAANVIQIITNIALSVWFANLWGIKGIAVASVLSKILFIAILSLHFSSSRNNLGFLYHFSFADLFTIIRSGIVKASTYGLEALLTFIINLFVFFYFDSDTIVILVVVERFLSMMTLFIGISMASQPLISTLRGENNTKAQRILIQTALKDMMIISGILTLILLLCAPLIVTAFGISGAANNTHAVDALRIVSSTLVLQAVLVFFFIYYVFIEKQALAFFVCLVKNFISPTVMAILLSLILNSQTGIWIGLAVAPILDMILFVAVVRCRYGRDRFLFMISEDPATEISIYDFMIDTNTGAEMSETVQNHMNRTTLSDKTKIIASMITEELLNLVREKNEKDKKKILAECTVMLRSDEVKLIFRDSGKIFDITDTDSDIASFEQYIFSSLMESQSGKLYMTTTGYNRNVFLFRKTIP